MDFFETVCKRASYRDVFTDATIPRADMERILDAGIRAPSGLNRQSTSFIVVENATLRKQISELLSTPATKTAPIILVVVSENIETGHGVFEIEDYAAAVENIMLAITASGYAGVWMDGMTKMNENFAKLKKLLEIPEQYTVRTIIPIGIPAKEVIQKEKKSMGERAIWKV